MTIVDLKKEYRKQLNIIKDDANGKSVRKEALDNLSIAYVNIIKEEPKCTIDTPKLIKEKFIDKLDVPDVIWFDDEELDTSETEELIRLENIRRIAYVWVKQNHPKLDDQTDKFGQIVNARMQLIIMSRQ